MAGSELTAIILAAGEGTRMKSNVPKVLHDVACLPMLAHVLSSAAAAGTSRAAIVIGPGRDDVAKIARAWGERLKMSVDIAIQNERLGTAHAALQARATLEKASGDIAIAFADTPLLTGATFQALRLGLAQGAAVVVAAFEAQDPTGYGRVLSEGHNVLTIREEKDASMSERAVKLCNGGIMAVKAQYALELLSQVGNANAKGEYYLPDIVEIARNSNLAVSAIYVDEDEVRGVNTRAQLAEVEALMQRRLRHAAMADGVTLIGPETVFFAHDTKLGQDVTIAPHVVFGPGVEIEGPSEILSFSHLTGCKIAKGARIGPFARIRPQTVFGPNVHIGNFVEINRSTLEADVAANHLSYIGDSEVGQGSNIGAGTITCNFDGADKHRTKIGRDVFVGSNTTIVAPMTIGDEVLIAAGSTITRNVPEGALSFGRAKQVDLPGAGRQRVQQNKKKRAERKQRES